MKKKTSITLSEEVLESIDGIAGPRERSSVIERILRLYLGHKERAERDRVDLERLNASAEVLDEEARDVLAYQALWVEDEDSR